MGYSNERKTPSSIKNVIVYLSGAQITREATVTLQPGINEIVFTELSPLINENSIQVSGLKTASILSVTFSTNYMEKKEATGKVASLESIYKKTEREIAIVRSTIKSLEEEQILLQSNKSIHNNQQGITVAAISAYAKHYRERMAAIHTELYDLNTNARELNEKLSDLRKELNKVQNQTKEQRGEIKLKLDTPTATTVNLQLNYLVSGAGWFPVYDLKASSTTTPLSLVYKAHIYQQTGIDWDQVAITLSTADPTENNTRPELTPLYLDFINPNAPRPVTKNTQTTSYKYNPMVRSVSGQVVDESGAPLPGVNVLIDGTRIGTTTDFDGNYRLSISEGRELSFSYLGFKTTQLPIYASQMNVKLEEDSQRLEEVVVMGYAKDLSGSTPGLKIKQQNMVAEAKPIYIVDGVPMDDISHLNQEEIQSLETLKGSNATSLYGTRASNGAIVITTRKMLAVESLTNKEFRILKKYSIPSITDVTVLEINNFTIQATYEYVSVPVLNRSVFLTAKVMDWEQYDLLPGEANIYFEGSHSGKTFIDPYSIEEALVVSLGADPAIVVERKQINSFKGKNFTGNTRILDKNYEITLKNNKNNDISITLLDRIPISQNKEIKVEDALYPEGDHDSKTGIVTWKVHLASKQSATKKVSYTVKYPKGRNVNL